MNPLYEQELYFKAKVDILKAIDSVEKLTPEQQQRLMREVLGCGLLVIAAEVVIKNMERRSGG